MKNLRKVMLLSTLAIIMQGCISSNTFHPVKHFDIGQPEIDSAPAFQLAEFTIDSRYAKTMFIRSSETSVGYAPYSHWVLSPEILLRNFILGAADKKSQAGTLCINILAIELRKKENTTYFVADYTLTTEGKSLSARVVSSEKISSFNPKFFAKAYRKFALKILADINSKNSKK